MMRTIALLATLAACGESVDETLPDYQGWPSITIEGNAPGHSDSVRVIYASPEATGDWGSGFGYPEGSVLVKEVYNIDDNGQQTDLRYLAIMRRKGQVDTPLENEGGWLFTETDGPTGPEQTFDFCWRYCHVAAPYNGAFYDYRKL